MARHDRRQARQWSKLADHILPYNIRGTLLETTPFKLNIILNKKFKLSIESKIVRVQLLVRLSGHHIPLEIILGHQDPKLHRCLHQRPVREDHHQFKSIPGETSQKSDLLRVRLRDHASVECCRRHRKLQPGEACRFRLLRPELAVKSPGLAAPKLLGSSIS